MPQTPLWEEIKIRVTVTEIAEEYGDGLRRAGRLMRCRCLCGQHSDTDPSFYLYPEDNHAHCFACGWHGDVIALYMLVEGISDRWQACKAMQARYLATTSTERVKRDKRPHQSSTPVSPQTILPEVRFILETAVAHYHRQLWKQAAVLRYMREARGLTDDTMTRMQIGYTDGHSLSLALREACVDLVLAGRIGLLRTDGSGEFFRQRIIFPIFDAGGQVVFLTGRQTEAEQLPKYLHLPNTPLLKRQPMQMYSAPAKHGVIVVEGPLDLAALVQWQLDREYHLIALLGVGYEAAAGLIAQYAQGGVAVLTLDQDVAGKRAAVALAAVLLERGVKTRVLVDRDGYRQAKADLASGRGDSQALCGIIESVESMIAMGVVQGVAWGGAKDVGELLTQSNTQRDFEFFNSLE